MLCRPSERYNHVLVHAVAAASPAEDRLKELLQDIQARSVPVNFSQPVNAKLQLNLHKVIQVVWTTHLLLTALYSVNYIMLG